MMTGAAPMTDSLTDAHRHVSEIVRASGSSFAPAMAALPPDRRRAMFSVYAYCRAVDDIADGTDPPPARLAQLAAWREELDRIRAGRPVLPVAIALADAIERFDLPMTELQAVLSGMEMDAAETMVRPPLDRLRLYCRRVAGSPGLLSIRIFGAEGAEAEAFALALGEALQLTNILRDVDEDAARGRLYLPHELLIRHGIGAPAVDGVVAHPHLPAVCEALAAQAVERFERADALLARVDRRLLRPAVQMMVVYRALLRRLRRRGWAQARRPVRVPTWEKAVLMLRAHLPPGR